jgi:hypothetical protein
MTYALQARMSPYLQRSPSPSTGRRNATVRKRFRESLTPLAANASAASLTGCVRAP